MLIYRFLCKIIDKQPRVKHLQIWLETFLKKGLTIKNHTHLFGSKQTYLLSFVSLELKVVNKRSLRKRLEYLHHGCVIMVGDLVENEFCLLKGKNVVNWLRSCNNCLFYFC